MTFAAGSRYSLTPRGKSSLLVIILSTLILLAYIFSAEVVDHNTLRPSSVFRGTTTTRPSKPKTLFDNGLESSRSFGALANAREEWDFRPPKHCAYVPDPEPQMTSLTNNMGTGFTTTLIDTNPKTLVVTSNAQIGDDIRAHLGREIASYRILNTILEAQPKSEAVQFIDAGSNHGVFAIDAALNGATHVYAIEPQPALRQRMRATFRLNNADAQIEIFPNAVLDKDSTIELTSLEGDGGVAHINLHGNANGPSISVKTTRLDCVPIRPGPIAALKMDIEGFELFGLESTKDLFDQHRIRNVFVEFGPPSRWQQFNGGTPDDGIATIKKMHDRWGFDFTILPSIGYDYMKKTGLVNERFLPGGSNYLVLPRENYSKLRDHLAPAGELFVWWQRKDDPNVQMILEKSIPV